VFEENSRVSQGAREPYEPPEVVRVKLSREEMAVAGCKRNITAHGPVTTCLRTGGPCRLPGS